MNKKKKNLKINKLVIILIAGSIIVEMANIVFSLHAGTVQRSVCPRSPLPAYRSTGLLILSSIIAIVAAIQINKERVYAVLFALFYIAIIAWIQPLLWFNANGGMDWCNFRF